MDPPGGIGPDLFPFPFFIEKQVLRRVSARLWYSRPRGRSEDWILPSGSSSDSGASSSELRFPSSGWPRRAFVLQ